MFKSMRERTVTLIGALDVPFQEDSSLVHQDGSQGFILGSLVNKGSQRLCDGGVLESGHSFINHGDRRMMMNIDEVEHVRNTWGIEQRCQVHR